MRPEGDLSSSGIRLGWLFELPAHSERSMRMESLIGRIRLVVVLLNVTLMLTVLDTSRMHMQVVWGINGVTLLYAVPIVIFQPHRRWRVFGTSMASTLLDTVGIMVFISATGGSASPFFPLYFLSATAVAMRFELRQAMAACALYAFTYAVAYLFTWNGTADAFGVLTMRCAYMLFTSIGVGYLAREENSRSMQVDEIERLNQQNAKLLSRSEKAARVDRLTGLLNRGSLEKEALRELRRAKAADGYLSVLFCDMDRLKRINDELGHDSGDKVMRHVGAALKRGLRPQDLVGRYGGDEFVVVLPNMTRETAYDRAEQIILQMSSVNEQLPDDLAIGLSVGIATFPFDAPDYGTLVKVADQAMYLAKRDGGNRVRTSNDLRIFWEGAPRAG
jgi:diguanylate cyclase (GGDEF)-like protein